MSARRVRTVLLCAALLPISASAQSGWEEEDDAPIPYEDGAGEGAPIPYDEGRRRQADPVDELREEADWDEAEPEGRLARLDDPHLGIGGEVFGGVLLMSSPRGALATLRGAGGVRFHWEVGRLIAVEPFTDSLLLDVTWTWSALREGTEQIFTRTDFHYFSAAPAWLVPLNAARTVGVYGQLGGGFAYLPHSLTSYGTETSIAGVKPLIQYGLGFRGTHPLSGGPTRMSWRAELTRFRRGYLNDTLVAVSVGAAF